MSYDRRPRPAAPVKWGDANPQSLWWRGPLARIGAVVMPIVGIVAGIVGPNAGPAVFGALWLPFSLWFVVRPFLLGLRKSKDPGPR